MESHTQPYVMNGFRKLVRLWTNHAQTLIQHLGEDQSVGLDNPRSSSPLPSLFDGFLYHQQKANTSTSDNFTFHQSKAISSPLETSNVQLSKGIEPTPEMSDGQQQNANIYVSETSDASQQNTNAGAPRMSDASQPHCTFGPSKIVLASDGFSDNCYAVLLSEQMLSSLRELYATDFEADTANLQYHQAAVIDKLKEILQDNEILKKTNETNIGKDVLEAIPERASKQVNEATAWGNWESNSWGIPKAALEANEGPYYEAWDGIANKASTWKAWGGSEWGDSAISIMAPEELAERIANEKYYETETRLRGLQGKLGFYRYEIRHEEENAWRTKPDDEDHDSALSLDLRYLKHCMNVSKEAAEAEKEHDQAYEERMALELNIHELDQIHWVDEDDEGWDFGPGPFSDEEMLDILPQKGRDRIHRWMDGITPADPEEEVEERSIFRWEGRSLGAGSGLTDREDCPRWARKIQAVREEGERLRESFGLAREENVVERCFDTVRGKRLGYARSV